MGDLEDRLRAAQGQSLGQRLRAAQQVPAEQSQIDKKHPNPFQESLGREFINNMLGIPRGVVRIAAEAANRLAPIPIPGGPEKLAGAVPSPTFTDIEAARNTLSQAPGSLLSAILPEQVSAISGFPQSPGDLFQTEKAKLTAEQEQLKQEHPFAVNAGQIVGDIATLVTGRSPGAGKIAAVESSLMKRLFFKTDPKKLSNVSYLVDKFVNSHALKMLIRGAGRSAETGAEAMVLDAVQGNDPFETAGYAAGGQMMGSVFLTGLKSVSKHRSLLGFGLSLGVSALAVGSLWEVIQKATPGGRDWLIPSLETGFSKVALFMLLGAASGATGGGRIRGPGYGDFPKRFPKLADAITALPRAGVISILTDLTQAPKEQQQTVMTVTGKLIRDPLYFGEDAAKRIQKSIADGNLRETILELQQDPDFQKKLFALKPPEMGNAQDTGQ